MPERFKRMVESLRLRMASTPVWADVMILADGIQQDPAHTHDVPGNLQDLVSTELRRRSHES